MELADYIVQNALILIPALYILGMIIKTTQKIPAKYIPITLLVFGVAGAIGILGISVDSIIQGILVTGATVYANQLVKQSTKKE